jgi:hypothetical protein
VLAGKALRHKREAQGEIEQCLGDLDSCGRPWVRLWSGEPEDSSALEILGGNGRYVLRESDGWTYYDPAGGEEEIEILPGDPGSRCPAYYVCRDLTQVLQIARQFGETGRCE